MFYEFAMWHFWIHVFLRKILLFFLKIKSIFKLFRILEYRLSYPLYKQKNEVDKYI